MRNKFFKIIGGILLAVSFCLVAYVGLGIIQGGSFSGTSIIRTGVIIGIPFIIGTVLLLQGISITTKKKKLVSYLEHIVFAIYIVILLYILFLGGRGYTQYDNIGQFLKYNINLVPFRTISEYCKSFINNTINRDIIIRNIFGNFILFMPMAVILSCIIKKFRTWRVFGLYMVIILCSVEVVQLLTKTGSLDIDDFILNMSGACLAFAIMKKEKIRVLCKRIYLM